MRTLLLAIASSSVLLGQGISTTTASHIRYGATLPATCRPATGDVFFKTAATIGAYQCLTTNTWTAIGGGAGTVTTLSVVTANGVSGSVANATTTPAITFTLGAITPSSIVLSGNFTGGAATNLDCSGCASVSLPAQWVDTANAHTYTAGKIQTFVPSATLPSIILGAGTPSAVTGGLLFMDNTAGFGWANGTAKIKFTNPATADRTVSLPDANSNTVIPDTGSTNNFLTAISSAGVISKAQPTLTNLGAFVKNAQTSTYQVLAGDFTVCKTITVASGTFTATLVASGSQPTDGQCVRFLNYGSGVVTIARSGQNINGAAANLTMAAGSASAPTGLLVTSDGTNYFAQPFSAGGGTPGGSDTQLQFNNAGAFGGIPEITSDGTSMIVGDGKSIKFTRHGFGGGAFGLIGTDGVSDVVTVGSSSFVGGMVLRADTTNKVAISLGSEQGLVAYAPAFIDRTGLSAAITATSLYTPESTGLYRISYYAKVTTAGSTSSILGGTTGLIVTYTDGTDSVAQTAFTLPEDNQAGSALSVGSGNTTNTDQAVLHGSAVVYAKTGVNMTYAFGYTSVGVTAMVYELRIRVERIY